MNSIEDILDTTMGALYEDVEKFFGDIFACYGRFLARYPVVFVLLSLLTSCLLGMGLLSLEYETDVETLYTPMGSPAAKDQEHLLSIFPDQTAKMFYKHQQLVLSTYGEIFVLARNGEEDGNVLTPEVVANMWALYQDIESISLEKDERGFTYSDLCASRLNACVVDGSVLLKHLHQNACFDVNATYPYVNDPVTHHREDLHQVLADLTFRNGCMEARAMRLRFNLRHDSPRQRELSTLWEKVFLDRMASYVKQPEPSDSESADSEPESDPSQVIQVSYSASESLDIELGENVGSDTEFFVLTIIIMLVYVTFVSSGGNWVSTRVLLAHAGILAALLAILASFGLMSMCGMKFVDICGVMPFLVLGVGVDDMFILMAGWRQTDPCADIEERVAGTLRSSAISVTITSLTDLLAFCIGATSPFLNVKNFCIYTGVAIFLCYLNQLTFFGGCLVLHARRVKASRHCATCRKTKTREQLDGDKEQRLYILCCSGEPPKRVGDDDSPCEKIPKSILPRLLLYGPTKAFVIVAFIVYLGVSIWGASQIKTGLKLENVVPESSYLTTYNNIKTEYFTTQGPSIMFVVENTTIAYYDKDIQARIDEVLDKAIETGYVDRNVRISWLQHYMEYKQNLSQTVNADTFVQELKPFLVHYPQYERDVLFDEQTEGATIRASRFYLASLAFGDSTTEGNMMTIMREIAFNSSLGMIAYSPDFIYYEHYVSILKNTLLAVGVAVIGMVFVALMFIPHPISLSCGTLTMVTIVVGMFGFMHFWDLALSAITTVQIILSVGFCIDFTVHISHAFMTATGKNRNERVIAALEKVGVPIINGALSSILGILMLAFASSYIFKSFFKTMLLVIVLGLAHALLLLPVILSFIGPRRTNKPRAFVPISSPPNRPPGDSVMYKRKIEEQRQRRLDSLRDVESKDETIELMQLNSPREELAPDERISVRSYPEEGTSQHLLDLPVDNVSDTGVSAGPPLQSLLTGSVPQVVLQPAGSSESAGDPYESPPQRRPRVSYEDVGPRRKRPIMTPGVSMERARPPPRTQFSLDESRLQYARARPSPQSSFDEGIARPRPSPQGSLDGSRTRLQLSAQSSVDDPSLRARPSSQTSLEEPRLRPRPSPQSSFDSHSSRGRPTPQSSFEEGRSPRTSPRLDEGLSHIRSASPLSLDTPAPQPFISPSQTSLDPLAGRLPRPPSSHSDEST